MPGCHVWVSCTSDMPGHVADGLICFAWGQVSREGLVPGALEYFSAMDDAAFKRWDGVGWLLGEAEDGHGIEWARLGWGCNGLCRIPLVNDLRSSLESPWGSLHTST